MANTPDFRFARTIPDMVKELRRPPVLPETGWGKIGISEAYEIPFENSWTKVTATGAAPPSFYLSEDGEVRMRGKIDGGTAGTTAFVLPEEVRPEYAETFICAVDGGGKANVIVQPDGQIYIETISS